MRNGVSTSLPRGAEWECAAAPAPAGAVRTCRAFGGRVAAVRHGARGQAREYLIIMEAFRVMANGNRTEPSGSGFGTGLTRDRPTLPGKFSFIIDQCNSMLLLLNALREGRLASGGKQDVSIDNSVQIIAGSNQGRSTSTSSRSSARDVSKRILAFLSDRNLIGSEPV